jgi:hypothetical protein
MSNNKAVQTAVLKRLQYSTGDLSQTTTKDLVQHAGRAEHRELCVTSESMDILPDILV